MNTSSNEPSQGTPAEDYFGYLVFVLRWKGSKSERFVPCLLCANGEVRWLKHSEDDSFNPTHLKPFHLKPVRVSGSPSESGQIVVQDISVVEDAWVL